MPSFLILFLFSAPPASRLGKTQNSHCITGKRRQPIQVLHISTFQSTYKCEYNDFISKYTDIETQIDFLYNDTLCST